MGKLLMPRQSSNSCYSKNVLDHFLLGNSNFIVGHGIAYYTRTEIVDISRCLNYSHSSDYLEVLHDRKEDLRVEGLTTMSGYS